MGYQQTKLWSVDNVGGVSASTPELKEAGLWIKNGEVIAFPTETVYGLGADATNEQAVENIFLAKGRPSDNPLIVHIGEMEQWEPLTASIPEMAKQLAEVFWPGPLTLIVPKSNAVSEKVTAGLSTVAVRMPAHTVARALIQAAGIPVAAPSANRSGRPSPTKAEHVIEDLEHRIAGVVDGGPSGYGLESTVVDCTGETCWILRPGGVTKEEIAHVLGENNVEIAASAHSSTDQTPRSPGMKYRHYAPDVPLYLVPGTVDEMLKKIQEEQAQKRVVAVLAVEEHREPLGGLADMFFSLGSRMNLSEVSASLYDHLRQADLSGADVILSETFPKEGLGLAIMNRLEKAATQS
ncbi:L-threonylcarbamoyladenylate synthase [Alteribacillus iranensis]|uniref:Threonylcarbamoyl-AMP synthase n=1 Tax=Alteribacillus iranensis TaxID=930128 RepID=A0A1I2BZN4_9BACI|nr:L-threonylcarbamoyladenylate synthase [Alteribacillus iranensis]SFE61577.1 translation factor SUA5 [Alteribacillus iranensis]